MRNKASGRRAMLIFAGLLIAAGEAPGQSIFGTNLIVNGDAEAGPGSGSSTIVSSIPGWTSTGANVIVYKSGYGITLDDIVPNKVGNNYFSNGNTSSNLKQTVDLSAGASTIDAGTVTFDASGYFGGFQNDDDSASMTVAFLDGTGKQLSSLTIGNVKSADRAGSGLYLRRQIGPVPSGARSATVTVNFVQVSGSNNAGADNLSLVLHSPQPATSLLGSNLIVNGDAERGLAIPESLAVAPDLPGWVRTADFTTDTYGSGDLDLDSPAPPDRGQLYFYGGPSNPAASAYQDIDVSSAASLIDGSSVKYALGAWLGGYSDQDDHTVLTVQFKNWAGTVLSTATLGPVMANERNGSSALIQKATSGSVPSGTRQIHVQMDMTRTDGSDNDGLADSLTLILSGGGVPSISPNGVVTAAAFGGSQSIGPGTWIEIYGQNLAPDAREWSGADFTGSTAPIQLDGVRVTIANVPAYIRYISSGQVNAQVPSGISPGQQQLVVTTPAGSSAPYTITVNPLQPGVLAPASFIVNGKQYLAALFPDGSTFVLPPNSLPGVTSRQAKPGETIIVYGIGFGPTTPNFTAGQIASATNSLATTPQVTFGTTPATLSYYGLAPNFVGLYQFNVVVPAVANNDLEPISFSVNGTPISQTLYTAVHQ